MNKKQFSMMLKIVLVGALIYFLVQKGFMSLEATGKALTRWDKIIPALLALFFSLTLGVVRWQWLLRVQGIQIKWKRLFQLAFIGNFFNIALPGAVSGDFVKAFYVAQEIQGNRSRAFGSILFDRVAGLSALVFVSAGALVFGLQNDLYSALLGAIKIIILVAAISVIFFYGYLFLVKEKYDLLLKILQYLDKRISFLASITRIYESLRHYHNYRFQVIKVLALSTFIHLTVGWSCLSFAQALGETHVSLLAIYIIVPLGLLISAIPLGPAGIGTGNVAFLYFFHFVGSERGADIFSLLALSNILFGLIGGLMYFRFKSHEHPVAVTTETANA